MMSWLVILNILVTVGFSDDVMTVPNTCNDLLPDIIPYISFFDQTGDLWAAENPGKSKKIYDVLAVRKLYLETTKNTLNPIDDMIKKYLCDCYAKNKNVRFDSNSAVIRKYMEKNLDKLLKDVKKEYRDMLKKNQSSERSLKLSESVMDRIKRMKQEAIIDMSHELNRKAF
ncbi:MAG: hypothetical protein V1647_02190 [Pseudomonadota bacterium]